MQNNTGGLEDFMVIKEQSVFNAANLSLWMVNVSQAMLVTSGEESILDLKRLSRICLVVNYTHTLRSNFLFFYAENRE